MGDGSAYLCYCSKALYGNRKACTMSECNNCYFERSIFIFFLGRGDFWAVVVNFETKLKH